ncbi:hypothetical protein K402DRAFT_406824 [Aulographum hederae CBS 113979]|uniref:Uncharacterized protein n=1 Tax=Aulographum hederae CBS 113979 TaxID=1176131 RepID=A0A6G1GS23_9PEZI|nr:hypothetical protein K402DRAFT_406824 [Aulographum hederae CBS 113979]
MAAPAEKKLASKTNGIVTKHPHTLTLSCAAVLSRTATCIHVVYYNTQAPSANKTRTLSTHMRTSRKEPPLQTHLPSPISHLYKPPSITQTHPLVSNSHNNKREQRLFLLRQIACAAAALDSLATARFFRLSGKRIYATSTSLHARAWPRVADMSFWHLFP